MARTRPSLIAVFLGGVAGALARAGLTEAFPVHAGTFPGVTFAVNVAGAAILGAVIALHRDPVEGRRALIGTGFCGALTTFSTLQVELFRLLDRGDVWLAFAYAATSVAAGYGAVLAGARLARGRAAA